MSPYIIDDPDYTPPAPECDGGKWLAEHIEANLREMMGDEFFEWVEAVTPES